MKYKNVDIRDLLPDERPRLPEWIKVKWIAALRSGTYEQGMKSLRKDTAYCCLGVLSELQGRLLCHRNGWIDGDNALRDGSLATDNPLNEILNYSGILAVTVYLTVEGSEFVSHCTSLAALNDAGATFDEIAWVIDNVF